MKLYTLVQLATRTINHYYGAAYRQILYLLIRGSVAFSAFEQFFSFWRATLDLNLAEVGERTFWLMKFWTFCLQKTYSIVFVFICAQCFSEIWITKHVLHNMFLSTNPQSKDI